MGDIQGYDIIFDEFLDSGSGRFVFSFLADASETVSIAASATPQLGILGSFRTDSDQSGTFSLNYLSESTLILSRAQLAGTYTSSTDDGTGYTATANLSEDFQLFGTDTNGCSYSGSISQAADNLAVYRFIGQFGCPSTGMIAGTGHVIFDARSPSNQRIGIFISSPTRAMEIGLRKL